MRRCVFLLVLASSACGDSPRDASEVAMAAALNGRLGPEAARAPSVRVHRLLSTDQGQALELVYTSPEGEVGQWVHVVRDPTEGLRVAETDLPHPFEPGTPPGSPLWPVGRDFAEVKRAQARPEFCYPPDALPDDPDMGGDMEEVLSQVKGISISRRPIHGRKER